MTDEDFIELSGRCEALSRLVCALVAELDSAKAIDGPAFAAHLGAWSPDPIAAAPALPIAAARMDELAPKLVAACSYRQSTAYLQKSRVG